MRKTIAIAIMTGLMLSSTGVMADYFQYVDELRKPGQTVEEARKEQMEQYREAMKKKYDRIERQYEKRKVHKPKADVAEELGLSDKQKSFMKKIHQERREFMKKKHEEIRAFHEQKEKEFVDSLNYEQKANFEKMKKRFHKKYMPKDSGHHAKEKRHHTARPDRQGL